MTKDERALLLLVAKDILARMQRETAEVPNFTGADDLGFLIEKVEDEGQPTA
jgi:hypothetical protein